MNNKSTLLSFAERNLRPYRISGGKILPYYCPFCGGGENEDQNTFVLNMETGGYKCLRGSCSVHGNIHQLAEFFHEHIDFEARDFRVGGEKQYKSPSQKLFPVTEEIKKYLNARCIGDETIAEFNISADQKGNIVFPFYSPDGKLTFVKYREPRPYEKKPGSQKEWREPGTKPILFGMDKCDTSKPLTICEGQLDAMSLFEAGVRNVVSVPSGCEDLTWIDLCWEWLDKFEKIILFGDHDAPGKEMVESVAKRLDESRCWIVSEYPENSKGNQCKDANEILCECGSFSLLETFQNAQPVPIKGIIRLGSVKRLDYTQLPRVKFGIPRLDDATGGLFDGTVTIMTGQASSGKSTLNGTICLNAIQQGFSVFCYSGELPKEKFLDWTLLQAAGSDWITLKRDVYRGASGEDVPYVNDDVASRIQEWFYDSFYLADNTQLTGENTADEVLRKCEQAARRYGCHVFVVDNLMSAVAGSSEERIAQIRFITKLKRFAVKYKAVVLLTAHPRKTMKGEKTTINDVSGALELVNLADCLLSIEKPDIRILKNRDSGVNIIVKCVYFPDSRRICQADTGDCYQYGWSREGLAPLKVRAADSERYMPQLSQPEPMF